jgi:hypothetical protein
MSQRLHTIAALSLVALVPLAPIGVRVYAALASTSRGDARSAAERILAAAPPPPGSSREPTNEYGKRAWDGEDLVPTTGWTIETAYRLPRKTKPGVVERHYRRVLRAWSAHDERIDCATLSVRPGCDARYVTFRRGRSKLVLDPAEYVERDGKTLTEYGVQVSQ